MAANRPSLLGKIHEHFAQKTRGWEKEMPRIARPWFRGQTNQSWPLLPAILRDGNEKHEFHITKRFRLLAPGFGVDIHTDRLDQWLFLMQHHGAPTRLLDWTESLNAAIFFACQDVVDARGCSKSDGVVYCLDPIFLNEKVIAERDFPVTWDKGEVLDTIRRAFHTKEEIKAARALRLMHDLDLPVAILPSTVHSRIRAQKACFTLHGSVKRDLCAIFKTQGWNQDERLISRKINREDKPRLAEELALAGVTYSTVFPDLTGLCKDLQYQFRTSTGRGQPCPNQRQLPSRSSKWRMGYGTGRCWTSGSIFGATRMRWRATRAQS